MPTIRVPIHFTYLIELLWNDLCHSRAQPMAAARITNDAAAGIFAECGAREKAVSELKAGQYAEFI